MRSVSIAGLLLMVAVVIGLIYTHTLFSRSPVVIALQGAAVALMLWARFTLGSRSFHAAADPTEGGLVTSGPYRFIRHPIYTAACAFCWTGIMAHGSVPAIAGGVLLTIGAILRMLAEERLVAARYPEYLGYAGRTKRMVPHVF